MKILKNHTALIMLIAIFSSCSKDMVHPATSNHNAGAKQLNSTRSITVSPARGIVFSAVTITGTGFSTTAANNIVKFNGVAAVENSATATQIVATVPAGATTGKVSVTVNNTTSTSASSFQVLQMVKVDSTNIGNNFSDKGIGFSLSTSDKNGNLYGIGTDNHRGSGVTTSFVFKYNHGTGTRLYNTPVSNGFYTFRSLILDALGNVYVAKNYLLPGGKGLATIDSAEILKITPNGQVSVLAGGNPGIKDTNGGTVQVLSVECMIIDAQGNLYAAVFNSDNTASLKKITPAGIVSTVTGFNAAGITAMLTDKSGNLYYEVAGPSPSSPSGELYSLKKRTPQGNTSTIFTQYYNFSMVIDSYNNIFASVNYSTPGGEVQNVYVINQANAVNILPSPNGPLYPITVLADVNGNFLTEYPWGLITVWNFK